LACKAAFPTLQKSPSNVRENFGNRLPNESDSINFFGLTSSKQHSKCKIKCPSQRNHIFSNKIFRFSEIIFSNFILREKEFEEYDFSKNTFKGQDKLPMSR